MLAHPVEVASAYALAAAEATGARASVWSVEDGHLRAVREMGTGPVLLDESACSVATEGADWSERFYEGLPNEHASADSLAELPPLVLSQASAPLFPFAWLPLMQEHEQVGLLILS